MDITVRNTLVVNGHPISSRQVEVLRTVHEEGSKNAAANRLGISAPVIHNYIRSIEKGSKVKLLVSTPLGTSLTDEALEILGFARMLEERCNVNHRFTIACSPVTQDLLLPLMSPTKVKGDLIVSDDQMNMRMLREGMVDVIILDDPIFLFDLEEFRWTEIGSMDMVHVDNGPSYIRYRYGAQRIAYSYLDSMDTAYTIDAETSSVQELINSGLSFFIDEFLLLKRGIKIRSASDKGVLRHSINAVYRKDSRYVERLMRMLKQRRLA